ncbi:MAG: 30S ribosomal protein S16 [Endomicrobium sp.]|uniref:30S ribosomal protein S16 n=1 Tax=Candidatus Endomicrobiellum pyrsonymphae TaxID=1408203 RepID=UPI00358AD2F4|nr:30S ribosomal protein S16 [Endomicrobium sp.]
MAVRLRLQRRGKPKRPYYRVVAVDQRSKRDGEPIEILGQYDPIAVDNKFNVNMDRVNYWLGTGAQASETVAALIKKNRTIENR